MSELVARALASRPSWPLLSSAMGFEVLLIVAAYFALASHAAVRLESFVVCMALALGVQNGAFRHTGGITVHTTYLTGMITGLITTQAETYLSPMAPIAKTAAIPKFALLYGIWAAFVLGAGTGAALVFKFGASALLGAAILLLAIIVRDSVPASRTAAVD